MRKDNFTTLGWGEELTIIDFAIKEEGVYLAISDFQILKNAGNRCLHRVSHIRNAVAVSSVSDENSGNGYLSSNLVWCFSMSRGDIIRTSVLTDASVSIGTWDRLLVIRIK